MQLEFQIMTQLRDNLLNNSMYEKYLNIQHAIEKEKISGGRVFSYTQPYTNNTVDVYVENENTYIKFQFEKEVLYIGKFEKNIRELSINAEKIEKACQKYKFTFAPLPNKSFIEEINKLQNGDILHLSNKLSVICVTNTDKKMVLKQQYEGDLCNLSINSFTNARTFIVNKETLDKDIHYLYGKAYDLRSNTADIRISLSSSSSYFDLKDIELTLLPGESIVKHIGPISLKAFKGYDNEVIWYDGDNAKLNRDLVAIMFGWAKKSMPSIEYRKDSYEHDNLSYFCFTDIDTHRYNIFLQEIKSLCFSQDFDKVIKKSFDFAKKTNSSFCINMTGLKDSENYNFNLVTYIFVNDKILEVSYDENNRIDHVKPVESQTFLEFCKAKYDNTCQSIINNNQQEINKYLSTHSNIEKSRLENAVLEEILKRASKLDTLENALGISLDDINHVSDETQRLLDIFLQNESELTVKEVLRHIKNEYTNEFVEENDEELDF